MVNIQDFLQLMLEAGASDLHITQESPPLIRVHGELRPLAYPPLTATDTRTLCYSILTEAQKKKFEEDSELDFSFAATGVCRFRGNLYLQKGAVGGAFRAIPYEIPPIEKLGLSKAVLDLAELPHGLVLVTGPTGSGKSTTLAAIINKINETRPEHIVTVEDPIEFVHTHKKAMVNQREVFADTHSFAQSLKHVLRQDPDIVLIGEMRDLETIEAALVVAETGHLVFSTLHTNCAVQTINRVIDVFPPHQQEQIRVMLAGALQGVMCQQLLKTSDGEGRVVATEVMIATPAIKNLIREGKVHQMYSMIQAGKQHGMVTMDQSLATLVQKGKVTYQAALEKCNNVADFNRLCGRA
jgi:twitching motility protein PilT